MACSYLSPTSKAVEAKRNWPLVSHPQMMRLVWKLCHTYNLPSGFNAHLHFPGVHRSLVSHIVAIPFAWVHYLRLPLVQHSTFTANKGTFSNLAIALDQLPSLKERPERLILPSLSPACSYVICSGNFEYLKQERVICLYGLHQMVDLEQLGAYRARIGTRKLGLLPW